MKVSISNIVVRWFLITSLCLFLPSLALAKHDLVSGFVFSENAHDRDRDIDERGGRTRTARKGHKSMSSFIQRMDSMVLQSWNTASIQWQNTAKEDYVYNVEGDIALFNKSIWALSNHWVVVWKEEYAYNAVGRMSDLTIMKWDSTLNLLVHVWKENYSYDAAGNILVYQAYSWNPGASAWVNSWKAEYGYDVNGNLMVYNDFYWNVGTNLWVNSWKAEYFYNASGEISLYQDYYWNSGSGQWLKSWKAEYSYNLSGNLLLYQEYSWNTAANLWVHSAKKEYTYTVAGLVESMTQYAWNTTNNQWAFSRKENFLYNGAGELSVHQLFLPNQAGNQWVNSWKAERDYDLAGLLTAIIDYHWNQPPGQWVKANQAAFIWDGNVLYDDIMMPFWYYQNEFFNKFRLERYSELVFDNTTWINTTKRDYYYAHIGPTGTQEPVMHRMVVSPNPANQSIFIQCDDDYAGLIFKLFDMSGKLILEQSISTNQHLPIGNLNRGLYLYSIQTAHANYRGKLMVDR